MDPQQIQQSILNVVLNAVEAMSSEGLLTISTKEKWGTESARKATLYVSLVVSDTGIGIPEERIAQIFNPFYTTKPSGTGLGLSITQRIIEQHNGTIDVKSNTGKGTSFTINLPV
jgi:signal transduction histidine kinase